jgi:hypothetical protein
MLHLDLTEAEAATLAEALEHYVSELRMEVAHTEQTNMRDRLKVEEEVLKKLLGVLKSKPATT